MKAINRTIQFGGNVAGDLTEGLLTSVFPTDPDSGESAIKSSWLWRLAGSVASAAPALGSGGAGVLDKAALKKQQEDQGKNGQDGQQGGRGDTIHNAPFVNIGQIVQGNQSGKSLGQDLGHQVLMAQSYNSAQPPVGPFS